MNPGWGRRPVGGARRGTRASGRRVATAAALALLTGAGVFVGAWLLGPGAGDQEPAVLWEVPGFALVDQTGDTLRAADLRGTAWAVSFFFTNCSGVCPLITSRMAALRDSLAAAGLLGAEVRLVSISVDPARDTLQALADYAARYGGSPPSEWAFLTGSPPEAVRRLIQEGFKVTASLGAGVGDPAGDYQVQHTPRLELVDRRGRVRGTYDATDPQALARLTADLERILE